MKGFCLKGYNGDKIKLEINKISEYPEDDGYYFNAILSIDTSCYSVRCDNYSFSTGALYRFADELRKCHESLEGKANYNMYWEPSLSFTLTMEKCGHAVVRGTFQEIPSKQNILEFEIETDQSYLLSVIQNIDKLKEIYEV